jgi:hypothetical protein
MMKEQAVLDDILTQSYKRMHRYSCAEASLQALLALWDMPKEGYSWATAGYEGAILSGQTTCGLLIGSSIAISLRCGQGKKEIPEEHETERGKAILLINDLYNDFLKKFGSTECKTLNEGTDFSNPDETADWAINKKYKQTCDVFLKFVFEKCVKMAEEEKI